MIKSISNTSLQEINLHEKLLDKTNNTNNNETNSEKISKIIKYTSFIVVVGFLIGYLIFIAISLNQ